MPQVTPHKSDLWGPHNFIKVISTYMQELLYPRLAMSIYVTGNVSNQTIYKMTKNFSYFVN